MKLDVVAARVPEAAEVDAPRSPAEGAKQAEHKVRFAEAMGRARGEGVAKAEPGAKDEETAEVTASESEARGKTRKKRTSGAPLAVLPFDVTVRPETKLALLPEGDPVAASALPKAGVAGALDSTKTATVLGELTQALPGAVPSEVPELAKAQGDLPEARAAAVETPEAQKPERLDVREAEDVTRPIERPEADARPEVAKADAKPVPTEARTTPRAEPSAVAKPMAVQQAAQGTTAREAQPKVERDAEPVAEKPRAVRAETTAKPVVALADFVPLREPVAVAMKPEVMPVLPRELVEPTPMLTAANLAQAVVTLPDLGRIEIRSRMQDGALEIDLRAERAEGRAALENAREALTVQVAAIAPVAQIVVGPTQVNAAASARPGHEGMLSDTSQQSRDPGGRDSSGGSRDRGGRHEESRPVAQMPRGRVRIVL